MPRRRPLAFIALVLMAGTAAWSLYRVQPHVAQEETAVSLATLRRHVEILAAEPHPVESDANRRVRDYILGELKAMGLEPVVEAGTILAPRGVPVRVENIVCRIAGRADSGDGAGGLLVCHYDSHPRAPGAGDDANAVAAMLETARLLAARGQPARDIVLLFTDGEEAGLLGAQVWAREHPDLMGCRVVANFEARGTSGAAVMFETAGSPADLFDNAYARGSAHPVTSSISAAVYERMPNGTDFTVFRLAGMSGLNFAFIDGFANYHTPQDNPQNLSDASLLHQAQQMHAVAEYFATADLPSFTRNTPAAGFDRVYFDLSSLVVVSYPGAWAIPLAIAASIVTAVAILRLRPPPWLVVESLARHVLALGVVLAWVQLASIAPMTHQAHLWTATAFAGAGMLVLASLPSVLPGGWPFRRRPLGVPRGQRERAALAALLCLLFIGTVATATRFVPGSYALVWPALLMALASCIRRPRRRIVALAIAAAGATLLLLPLAWLVTLAMTLRLLAAGTALLVVIGWIWRPAMAPLLRPAWPVTALGTIAGGAALGVVLLS